MPDIPWRSLRAPGPNDELFGFVSSIPVKSLGASFLFLRRTPGVQRQLADAPGLVGYTLRAKPFAKRFYTASVWESEEAMARFVGDDPHLAVMREMKPRLGAFRSATFRLRGDALPLRMDAALAHLDDAA